MDQPEVCSPTSTEEDLSPKETDDSKKEDLVSKSTDSEQTESLTDEETSTSVEATEDQFDPQECITEEKIQKLSHDLMDLFLPNLELAKKSLHELTQNQKVLIETVQQENAKFDECSSREKLAEILSNAKTYHIKLLTIKKQMILLQDKSVKLKKRALRLQQQKQKEELQKAQQQENEMEKEQLLVAKVISNKH